MCSRAGLTTAPQKVMGAGKSRGQQIAFAIIFLCLFSHICACIWYRTVRDQTEGTVCRYSEMDRFSISSDRISENDQ